MDFAPASGRIRRRLAWALCAQVLALHDSQTHTNTGYFTENNKKKELKANLSPNIEKHASYLIPIYFFKPAIKSSKSWINEDHNRKK